VKVVYVAGKFTGPTARDVHLNVYAAEKVAMLIAEAEAMPLTPHLNTKNFDGTKSPEFWYAGTLELLRRCDAMMLVPGWEASKGVAAEMEEADRRNIPVFESIVMLKAWLIE
jgi:Domain of unknown function (DUF4406)